MKRTITAIALALSLSAPAFAQQGQAQQVYYLEAHQVATDTIHFISTDIITRFIAMYSGPGAKRQCMQERNYRSSLAPETRPPCLPDAISDACTTSTTLYVCTPGVQGNGF